MSARDRHRAGVRRALEKDGWQVTHDPLHLRWGVRDLYVDVREELFEEPLGALLLENSRLRLLVFNPSTEVITAWTPSPPTAT